MIDYGGRAAIREFNQHPNYQNRYNIQNQGGAAGMIGNRYQPANPYINFQPAIYRIQDLYNNHNDPLNNDNDEQVWQERKRRFLGLGNQPIEKWTKVENIDRTHKRISQ